MVRIWYMELIFQKFHYLSTCPLVHTFWHDFKGLRKKKKTWNRKTASCPHVHTFCKYLKGYKKEKKTWNRKTSYCPHVYTFEKWNTASWFFFQNIQSLSTCPQFLKKYERVQERKKTWNGKTASCPHSTLLKNEIHEIDFFSSESSKLVHLSTLFSKNLKGTRKKENMKHKDSFLSTYPHFWIMKYVQLSLKFSEFSELVHLSTIFAKHFGG